jgi:hypothetical protein
MQVAREFESGARVGQFHLPAFHKSLPGLRQKPALGCGCKSTARRRRCRHFGKSISSLIAGDVALGGAPERRDPPAKELEDSDSREYSPSVFVIFVVRLESVDCGLVIDRDKQCSSWYCDGEKGGDSFLHSVKLGIVHFSPITEMKSCLA